MDTVYVGAGERLKNFLKANVYLLVTALAGVIYIARGLIKVVETGKNPYEIIADGLLAILFGFFISKTMGLQGIMRGENDERVIATRRRHSEIVEQITPFIDSLDGFCLKKTEETRREIQNAILAREGLTYADMTAFLSGEPINLGEKSRRRKKLRAIGKAKRLRITPLTTSSLTGDEGNPTDPLRLGITKKRYMARTDAKRFLSKIGTGLLFGYFGVQAITDFSWAQLIWTALQTVMFLIMGVSAYMQSYFFITDNYRSRLIRKMDYLQMFKNSVTSDKNDKKEIRI